MYEELSENRRQYASRWDNVQYQEFNEAVVEGPAHWNKPMLIRSLMKDESINDEIDWIWWLDADAAIMDCSVSITDLILEHAVTADSVSLSNVSLIFNGDPSCLANTGSFAIRNDEWGLQFMNKWLFLKDSGTNEWADSSINGWKDQPIFNALLVGWDPVEDHSEKGTIKYVLQSLSREGKELEIPTTLSRIAEEIRGHIAVMPGRLWNSWWDNLDIFVWHCAGDAGCKKKEVISKIIRTQSNCHE